jgi:4-alpha-glucanotransferase
MSKLLHSVARLYYVQANYRDGLGQMREAPPEAVFATLQALGAPVETMEDLDNAYRQRRQALWQRCIEPVVVVWQDEPIRVRLRVPRQLADTVSNYRIVLESGEALDGEFRDDPAFRPAVRDVESISYITRRLIGPAQLPLGYHRLYLRIGDLDLETHLFCAPIQAYALPDSSAKRWGLFCPLYALQSAQSWGAGDFSDMERLIEFTVELGGHTVATLPLLASFLDEPFNPSPYAPVSRLFWNEFFLDVTKIADLDNCQDAQVLLNSDDFRRQLESVRSPSLVDYRGVSALKRRVLEDLLSTLVAQDSHRRASFEKYVASHLVAQDYAAFRAKTEHEKQSWPHWPAASGTGKLRAGDFERRAQYYHLYVQWQCEEQISALREKTRAHGATLYLDFPLGVSRDGYDVWRHRELFALGVNGGAPPDGLFVSGQNWGFAPLHPETIRQQGYGYYVDCLRHHLCCAGMLRIDHVMGLHRAFWIPAGFSATDGVYVHYRAPEFYAVLNLESHRHRVQVVGENLGTVPGYVNEAMARRKLFGMHVGQFGVNAEATRALEGIPRHVVASLNTHDTATFMGFWQGKDIDDRVDLGLLDETQADNERRSRGAQRDALIAFLRAQGRIGDDVSAAAVLSGWLTYLAGQNEDFLLVNLEDLWLEPAPQNVPGTWQERPNWKRKSRHSLEEIRQMGAVTGLLKTISDIRARIV